MISLAKIIARNFYEGQLRKDNHTPYIKHPEQVAQFVKQYGGDEEMQAVAWLHDVIEDTICDIGYLRKDFSPRVVGGVAYLTRIGTREEYKKQLLKAPLDVQLVKLCDVLSNTQTLHELSAFSAQRYVTDVQEFYLPMAERVQPALIDKLNENIEHYVRNNPVAC